MKRRFTFLIAALGLLVTFLAAPQGVWGQSKTDPTVLFHETFGDNSGKARAWDDSYSVKSGVSAVYSGITSYTVSNVKQGKNTTGSTLSGLNQSSQGTDAYIIFGPLNVANYTDLSVTYQWKAASINGTYSTSLYYATSSGGSYEEVSGTGTGATSFVERSYSLPEVCEVTALYLKVVFNTSNTQAIIDEFEITGFESTGPQTYSITYDCNGGNSGCPENETDITSGESVNLADAPTKTNYTFIGWNDGVTTYDAGYSYTVNGNVTMTAQWTGNDALYSYSINGVEGEALECKFGDEIDLEEGSDLSVEFTFAGWVTDPNNVSNLLSGSYTISDETTTFYAVYAKTTEGTVQNVVVLDGEASELSSTQGGVTMTENGFEYYSSNAKYQAVQSGAENYFTAEKAILIGKTDKYLKNNTAFGQGITKFEVYVNKGASASVSVGIYFSTNVIEGYLEGGNTWTESLSIRDNVYDASSALPEGAKYFWYQVTNDYNSQVQFRITYNSTGNITTYYTRVFQNETATANISITGPSIIASGSTLNMGTYALTCNTPANLVIEDGGQLITSSPNVQATVQKSVTGATSWTGSDNSGWMAISSPVGNIDPTDVTNMTLDPVSTTPQFDLYKYEESFGWRNYNKTQYDLENGYGYLYARNEDATLNFCGTVTTSKVQLTGLSYTAAVKHSGLHLIGNPYTHDIYKGVAITGDYLVDGYYALNESGSWISTTDATAIKPMQAVFVFVLQDEATINITNTADAPVEKANHDYIRFTVANNQYEDVAYAMFDKGYGLNKIEHRNAEAPMIYIPRYDENYAIAMMDDDVNMFGLDFKANTMGKYTLNYKTQGEYSYLHVIDRLTGEDVDMLLDGEYSFIGSPTDAEDRFIVKLSYDANNGVENTSDIFAYQNGTDIIVEGEGELQVFDLMGRHVLNASINGTETISTSTLNTGVYVMRLNGKVQKIVVR